jgi:hypothetical protein
VAAASVALPWAARRGRWGVAVWSGAAVALAALPVPALPLVACIWLTAGVMLLRT